ncbi:MAG TPA: hypothetical protein VJL29_07390 [Thermoguttaceae bacterium]|nr:hypothetical protein [Thermoguttaceae bacterium]
MTEDEKYLDLLAIFHYVVGGLTGLFACFPLILLMKDSVKGLFVPND